MSRTTINSEAAVARTIPHHFLCPITLDQMTDPVMCIDGHSYERAAITAWLNTNDTSPATNLHLKDKSLIPNIALRESIREYSEESSRYDSEKMTQGQQAAEPLQSLTAGVDAAVIGDYPIHYAIRNNNLAILAAILSENTLKQSNRENKKAVELAADLGYWDLVIQIAKKHALETPTNEDPYNYNNVLYKAAVENKTEAFLVLLRAGARTNTTNNQGDFVNHIAVRNKNFQIWDAILTLIKNTKLTDSNLSVKNGNGKTPIELAADLGYWDLVIFIAKRYAIQSDSHENIKDGYFNVLAFATSQNKTDVVTTLLKAGASVDRPFSRQQAPAAVAATGNVAFFPAPARQATPAAAGAVPSLARLKNYYLLEAGFFNASGDIFNTERTDKVIEKLRERAKSNPGGASEKTLEVFGIPK